VNGQAIGSATDLTRAVGTVHAGDAIRMEVRREGQSREVVVRSGARPSEDQLAANGQQPGGKGDSEAGVTGALGLSVAPDPQGHGVRVAGVDGASDAAQKGLRRGDLILQVGGRAAHVPADITAAVAEARKAGRHQVLLFHRPRRSAHLRADEIGEG